MEVNNENRINNIYIYIYIYIHIYIYITIFSTFCQLYARAHTHTHTHTHTPWWLNCHHFILPISCVYFICFRFCLLGNKLVIWILFVRKRAAWYNSLLQKFENDMLYCLAFTPGAPISEYLGINLWKNSYSYWGKRNTKSTLLCLGWSLMRVTLLLSALTAAPLLLVGPGRQFRILVAEQSVTPQPKWSRDLQRLLYHLLGEMGVQRDPIRSINWSCQALAPNMIVPTIFFKLLLWQTSS